MPLSVDGIEAALVRSGFAIVERDRNGPFGSWYLAIEHESRIRLKFDGRDGWLIIEWETNRFFGDLREWDPLWIGKSTEDLRLLRVMRMLESARSFGEATVEAHRHR